MKNSKTLIFDLFERWTDVIDAGMSLSRALWRIAMLPQQARIAEKGKGAEKVILDVRSLSQVWQQQRNPPNIKVLSGLMTLLKTKKLCWDYGPQGTKLFNLLVFEPLELVHRLVDERSVLNHELKYFVRRNIRWEYSCIQSFQSARMFKELSNSLNEIIHERQAKKLSKSMPYPELKRYLIKKLTKDG